MRILVIGQYAAYYEHGYRSLNNVIIRECNVAVELARLGHQVAMTGSPTDDPPRAFDVVPAERLRIADYDGVILIPEFATSWVAQKTDQLAALQRHPNVVAWRDSMCIRDTSETAMCKQIGNLLATQVPEMRGHGFLNVHHLPWAMTDIEEQPSPWVDDWPRVIYTGFMTSREIAALNAVAEKIAPVELWVSALYGDAPGGTAAMNDEERSRLFGDRVHFMTDLVPHYSDNVYSRSGAFHGLLLTEDYVRFLWHADAAIVLSRWQGLGYYPSKLYSYLSFGLPVAMEHWLDNSDDAVRIGAGEVVDTEELPNAVLRALSRSTPAEKERIRSEGRRQLGTWADRAKTLEGWLLS